MQDKCFFNITEMDHKKRLDIFLVENTDLSRNRIKQLIVAGNCQVNAKLAILPSLKLGENSNVELNIPPLDECKFLPENIDLDIIFEDSDVLVINKPAGLVVHPAVGNWSGTLVNALLYHCGSDLSGIGGVSRPGIIHRLDKETSGIMIVAKNDIAHNFLAGELQKRNIKREYEALVIGNPRPQNAIIDFHIGRSSKNRLKKAVVGENNPTAKTAKTEYKIVKKYGSNPKNGLALASLLQCNLYTGRTHQIRVHLSHIGFPIIGDGQYGKKYISALPGLKDFALKYEFDSGQIIQQILQFERQALHARQIIFIHPTTGKEMNFMANRPDDFNRLERNLQSLNDKQGLKQARLETSKA